MARYVFLVGCNYQQRLELESTKLHSVCKLSSCVSYSVEHDGDYEYKLALHCYKMIHDFSVEIDNDVQQDYWTKILKQRDEM